MSRSRFIVFVSLCLLASPAVASANVGSVMVIATAIHLLFGNLFIGLLEGGILILVFKRKWWIALGVMIVANYFSAWIGFLCMGWIRQDLHLNLYNAWTACWIMMAAAYVMTLLLESPFIAVMFRRDPKWLRKTVLVSLLTQTASYGVLIWWYHSCSSASLYTQNQIVDVSQMSLPAGVTVCYIDADDGGVYSRPLVGGRVEKIGELDSRSSFDRLSARVSDARPDRFDLLADIGGDGSSSRVDRRVLIREAFAMDAGQQPAEQVPPLTYWMDGAAAKLSSTGDGQWNFACGYWPYEGMVGERADSGKTVRIAYETPLTLDWYVRCATLLPGDIVLFQLGRDQICVYDPNRHQVAMIARGHGPIAVMLPGL